ncbi:MAG: NTPase [Thaumarchaeota archaeon]|nr:NTPase [Nitrososphaerota archaeon]
MQQKRAWLVTGDPGSGKTTLISRVVLAVRSEGFTVGGIITKEIREKGERTGFRIVDIASRKSGMLASTNQPYGPRVGKYKVNLKDLAEIGSRALESAIEYDLVVCDEMGPMELFSPEFRRAVQKVTASSKPVLGSIHKRLVDPLIEEIKANPSVEVIDITEENRDSIEKKLKDTILQALEETR